MKRTLLKCVCFLLIGGFIFYSIQAVFTPNWENNRERIYGMEALTDNALDVLFLGTSHAYNGISPLQIYDESKIVSYNMGTSSQPLSLTYYMLDRVYSKTEPSVIVLDVGNLLIDEKDENTENRAWRYVLDSLLLDADKVKMSAAYEEVEKNTGMLSALFPLIAYHERWSELAESDFEMRDTDYFNYGGFRMTSNVIGNNATNEKIQYWEDCLVQLDDGAVVSIENGNRSEHEITDSDYEPKVIEWKLAWLEKILALCKEHGSELLLTKVPTGIAPQYYQGAWTSRKSELARKTAENYGIDFLDLQYDVDLGLDFSTDTCDGGQHLNIRGAQKVSSYLASYLSEHYDLQKEPIELYENQCPDYKKLENVARLQSEYDFHEYLRHLSEHLGEWSVVIAASGEYTQGLVDAEYNYFEQLGLQLIREGNAFDSYVGVITGGNVIYEGISDKALDYSTTVGTKQISAHSAGWYNCSDSTIMVSGTPYVQSGDGLHFVVIDDATGVVIDQVIFNTNLNGKPAARGNPNSMLQKYGVAVKASKAA